MKHAERILYGVIWLLVALLPVVLELWEHINDNGFDWKPVTHWWIGMIPLLAIFLVNNLILIPKYLTKGRIKGYCLAVLLVLSAYGMLQYSAGIRHRKGLKEWRMPPRPLLELKEVPPMMPPAHGKPARPPRPFPSPLLFKLLMAAMTIGSNVAVSLVFAYNREQADKREQENKKLLEELKYLKQQISPHFLMNVLNNIHELAEEDTKKAQDMILKLSHLMRYVLYDCENDITTLAAESRFISSYVALMKIRYVEEFVKVNLDVQAKDDVRIPPLLFISFIENAFKHGSSYTNETMIDIKLHETNGKILFCCDNTLPMHKSKEDIGGVGLSNIRRRLDLLYGDEYSLRINQNNDIHSVTLIIPSR